MKAMFQEKTNDGWYHKIDWQNTCQSLKFHFYESFSGFNAISPPLFCIVMIVFVFHLTVHNSYQNFYLLSHISPSFPIWLVLAILSRRHTSYLRIGIQLKTVVNKVTFPATAVYFDCTKTFKESHVCVIWAI